MAFDPYETWLGIPTELRPPTYYDLLGLASHESDPVAIEQAALRRMGKVILHQTGPHGDESHAVLAELAQARQVLMDPDRRADYNAKLRAGGASGPGPSEAQENVGIADAADVVIEPEIAAPDVLSSLVLTDEREGERLAGIALRLGETALQLEKSSRFPGIPGISWSALRNVLLLRFRLREVQTGRADYRSGGLGSRLRRPPRPRPQLPRSFFRNAKHRERTAGQSKLIPSRHTSLPKPATKQSPPRLRKNSTKDKRRPAVAAHKCSSPRLPSRSNLSSSCRGARARRVKRRSAPELSPGLVPGTLPRDAQRSRHLHPSERRRRSFIARARLSKSSRPLPRWAPRASPASFST